jgi:hypothetical protein
MALYIRGETWWYKFKRSNSLSFANPPRPGIGVLRQAIAVLDKPADPSGQPV